MPEKTKPVINITTNDKEAILETIALVIATNTAMAINATQGREYKHLIFRLPM